MASIVLSTCITTSAVLPHQTTATDNDEAPEQFCPVHETLKSEMTTTSSSVESLSPSVASSCITPPPVFQHQAISTDVKGLPEQSSSVCETQNTAMTTTLSSVESLSQSVTSSCITPPPKFQNQAISTDVKGLPEQSSSVREMQNTAMTITSSSVESLSQSVATSCITPPPVFQHQAISTDVKGIPEQLCSVCETQNTATTSSSSGVESLPPIVASSCITPSPVFQHQAVSTDVKGDPEQSCSVCETQNTAMASTSSSVESLSQSVASSCITPSLVFSHQEIPTDVNGVSEQLLAMTTSSSSLESLSPIVANRCTAQFVSTLLRHQARSTENEEVPEQPCIVYSRQNSAMASTSSIVEAVSDFNIATQIQETNLRSGGDVELGETSDQKAGRQLFRWNLIFNVILWIIIPVPLWLPFVSQEISFYLLPIIQGAFSLLWIVVCLSAIRTTYVLYRHKKTDFKAKLEDLLKTKHIDAEARTVNEAPTHHLAVMSCYKEPVDLIAASVETLANQTVASNVTMVIAFEEKTTYLLSKQKHLSNLFGCRFHEMLFVTHPFGVEGEIPGKCSNANCGIRTGLAHMKQRRGNAFDPDRILVTTCDADSKFHPRYFEALEYRYQQESMHPRGSDGMVGCVFQSPLLYNWNLDAASVVTRVTGIVRSFLMMGAMIPFNVNPMSIYSFSASLCIAGKFVHPGYQMDDIIALIR